MQRVTGVFEAPRHIEGLRLYRLVGAGCLDVSELGLGVSGTAVDRPVPFNGHLAAVGTVIAGSVLAIGLDRVPQIMPAATVIAGLLWMWHSWKEAEQHLLRWTVPWSAVERVVQIPQHPERFAVILGADATKPETVYFTPTDGAEAFLALLQEHAPSVQVETEAAKQAELEEANAEPIDEDADDDSPWAQRQ